MAGPGNPVGMGDLTFLAFAVSRTLGRKPEIREASPGRDSKRGLFAGSSQVGKPEIERENSPEGRAYDDVHDIAG
jgi:hypothetical protein